jgi:hypothetical protein
MAQRFSNDVFVVGEFTGWQKGLPLRFQVPFGLKGLRDSRVSADICVMA